MLTVNVTLDVRNVGIDTSKKNKAKSLASKMLESFQKVFIL